MSPKSVIFDEFCLLSSSKELKLTVTCVADFQLPFDLLNGCSNLKAIEALASGDIWVTRGVGCQVDIQITFNGHKEISLYLLPSLQSFGLQLRNMPIWSQLILNSSLEPLEICHEPAPTISFQLHHSPSFTEPNADMGAWLINTVDVAPPESVLCGTFHRLQVHFTFYRIQQQPILKRPRLSRPEPRVPRTSSAERFSQLASAMSSLEKFSVELPPVLPQLSAELSKAISSFLRSDQAISDDAADLSKGQDDGDRLGDLKSGGNKQIKRLPKEAVRLFSAWFDAHLQNPYPTRAEKQQLMGQTGLRLSQIETWFNHARRRRKLEINSEQSNKLNYSVTQFNELNPLDTHWELPGVDGDTPIQPAETPPAKGYEDLAPTMSPPLASPLKRSVPTDMSDDITPSPILDMEQARQLADTAMKIIIGGQGRDKRSMHGMELDCPTPKTSLSSTVPAVFSPGFKASMASNALYLPTISHVFSSSLVQNAQSLSLRRKLEVLTKSTTPFEDTGEDEMVNGDMGSAKRVGSVVQARLWSMTHRKLYDPHATRRLWSASKSGSSQRAAQDESEFEDLLANDSEEDLLEEDDLLHGEESEREDLCATGDDDLEEVIDRMASLTTDDDADILSFSDREIVEEKGSCSPNTTLLATDDDDLLFSDTEVEWQQEDAGNRESRVSKDDNIPLAGMEFAGVEENISFGKTSQGVTKQMVSSAHHIVVEDADCDMLSFD